MKWLCHCVEREFAPNRKITSAVLHCKKKKKTLQVRCRPFGPSLEPEERPVPEPYQRVASLAMAEPSPPPPPSNSGLRILLAKDRAPTSSPSAPAAVSSHADRDRIIVSPLSSPPSRTLGASARCVPVREDRLPISLNLNRLLGRRECSGPRCLGTKPPKLLPSRQFRKRLNLRYVLYS